MCIAVGSVNQAVSACPMCKVFPHARCPHVRDICRNRALHPQLDVLYLKNAEVDLFNGCGYCKWARINPPQKALPYNNPGWPGCCRCPSPNEYRMIPAADWRSVSTIYHIAIPSDVKAILDTVSSPKASSSGSPRSPNAKPMIPMFDRRNSGNSSPPTKASAIPGTGASSGKPSPASKARGGSPSITSASLSRATGLSSSPSNISTLVDTHIQRDATEKPKSSQSSPSRKLADLLEGPATPRRNSGGKSTLIGSASTTPRAEGKSTSQSPERRKLVSTASKSSPPPRPTEISTLSASKPSKDSEMRSSHSSSGSSDGTGSGSFSDNTITSDGGFTDYLSDESEAELQRQAEARAALLAQNQAEELEFKAVRQRLAHVDLRPPKSWNPTNITNTGASARSSQIAAGDHRASRG